MKKFHFSSIAAGALLLAGAGMASAQTVVISPENEVVIREYVTTQKLAPIAAPTDVEITVGTALPETVEVRALEVPDMETRYSYVVLDGRTVLVEPETRKIVHIME